MRVLLDTNILIHREAAVVVLQNIGLVFNWLDRLHYEKCVHPASAEEIQKHKDRRVRSAFAAKLQSYHLLKTLATMAPEVEKAAAADVTENDRNDTRLVNELYSGRVDLLITEDRGLARKADSLGVGDRTFTIDAFLEKVNAENPALADYKVPSVRKVLFGEVDVKQPFFHGFREDYGGDKFDRWFNRKSDEPAYVCVDGHRLVAFLYLKTEGRDEAYADIDPPFAAKRRLKIGTLKVELNGFKLGERFLKIVFDNALRQRVDEIYVTIFPHTIEQQRLVSLLEDFGFARHGVKRNAYGDEQVYVRDFAQSFNVADPKLTFPYFSRSGRHFIVPIYPDYHTSLLPDSILRTESPADFVEQEPHRNAIRKIYVSRSMFRDLKRADAIIFYRTAPKGKSAYYHSVVTTVGIVEGVYKRIADEAQFIRLCRKRSVFTDDELRAQWNYNPNSRPFIVGFLYAYSFPKRPNLKELIDNGIIKGTDSVPRGFEEITPEQFERILKLSKTDPRAPVN